MSREDPTMDGPHDYRHSPDLITDEAEGLALWRQYLAELRQPHTTGDYRRTRAARARTG